MKCNINERIKLVSGDNFPKISISLLGDQDEPISLVNRNVQMKFREKGTKKVLTVVNGILLPGKQTEDGISFEPPYNIWGAGGRVLLSWKMGALDLPAGLYEGEVVIIGNNMIWTMYDPLQFIIRDDF